MRYGQGYDSMVCLFGICLGSVAVIYGALRCLQRLDRNAENMGKCSIIMQGCLCIISCEVICLLFQLQAKQIILSVETVFWLMLLSALAACMLAACVMDLESCMVYNYVWWTGGIAAGILMGSGVKEIPWELILFILLQELFFCRMYGRADCHAFSVCAMVEAAWGMNMQVYLIHMLLAFVLLAVVQGIGRNIGRNGNLKQPVAFLPYITLSFWGVILFHAAFG